MAAGGTGSAKERRFFKVFMWAALILVTVGLAGLSVSGAWIKTESYFFTLATAGGEFVAFSAPALIVYAVTRLRRFAGFVIFVASVAFCITSAEFAIKHYRKITENPDVLRLQAEELEEQATEQKEVSKNAATDSREEQRQLRDQIAKFELERELMQSKTRIEEAQLRLQVLGLYFGEIDGVRGDITKKAMRQRGEDISREIAIARQKLISPSEETVSTKASDLRILALEKRERADEIERDSIVIKIILAALELIRSGAVWAFIMSGTTRVSNANRTVTEETAETEATVATTIKKQAENELSAAEAGLTAEPETVEPEGVDAEPEPNEEPVKEEPEEEEPEPVEPLELNETEPEPEPAPEPEPVEVEEPELTPHQQNSRKGGLANAHAREAERDPDLILVTDDREVEAV